MDTMDIKRIINEYSNQLYAHKLGNLDEMHPPIPWGRQSVKTYRRNRQSE